MKVFYCDLCGQPLKDNEIFSLSIITPTEVPHPQYEENIQGQNVITNAKEYYDYMDKVDRETKEICLPCKKLFDLIFQLRLQNLMMISNELLGIYNLPSLLELKDKNDKKKKTKN